MKITIVTYDDLPEDKKAEQLEDGVDKEGALYLKVEMNRKPVVYYSDALDPEDANFRRGLAWLKYVRLAAYHTGL